MTNDYAHASYELKFSPELEGLRGLAACLIFLHYLPKWNPILKYFEFVNNSYLLVNFFFVLSGYVIYTAYSDKIERPCDLFRFQFLRFGRTYPVHLFFLSIFIFFQLAIYFTPLKHHINTYDVIPFTVNTLSALLQQLLLMQSFGDTSNLVTFSGSAWSISALFYTYLIFGVIILWFKRYMVDIFAVIASSAFVLLAHHDLPDNHNIIGCFAGFFMGCLAAKFTRNSTIKLPGLICWLAISAMAYFIESKPAREYDNAIYPLSVLLIISVTLTSDRNALKRILRSKPLAFLGRLSYSTCLSSATVFWIVNETLKALLKQQQTNVPYLSITNTALTCCVVAVAVLFISSLIYSYIERPMRIKSRQFALRSRVEG
jgi:peptidoglycan/LPS O-acetylase OafA/YrhL